MSEDIKKIKIMLWGLMFLLVVNLGVMHVNTDSIRSKVAESVQSLKPVNIDGKFYGVCIDPPKVTE